MEEFVLCKGQTLLKLAYLHEGIKDCVATRRLHNPPDYMTTSGLLIDYCASFKKNLITSYNKAS